jgi:hypothetical protein
MLFGPMAMKAFLKKPDAMRADAPVKRQLHNELPDHPEAKQSDSCPPTLRAYPHMLKHGVAFVFSETGLIRLEVISKAAPFPDMRIDPIWIVYRRPDLGVPQA